MADDAEIMAEIARLTSAIDQHKRNPTATFAPSRGRGRGRGRAAYPSVATHRNATWVAPGLRSGSTTPVDSTSPSDLAFPPAQSTSRPATAIPPPGRGGYRNQTLVLSRAAGGKPQTSTSGRVTPLTDGVAAPGTGSDSTATDKEKIKEEQQPQREVVIDGMVFVADSRGNKLVRKTGPPIPSTSAVDSPATPSVSAPLSPVPSSPALAGTPKRASHLGTTYIRTKSGNLVSLAFARERKAKADEMRGKRERLDKMLGVLQGVQQARNANAAGRGGRGRGRGRGGYTSTRTKPTKPKSNKLCRFFQKTGQCSRAHTCPYVHDSTKIAICPQFLRSSCPRPASSCPLSHSPNPHRSPHCVHFPSCTRGAECPYAHVVVSKDAPVCREFVEYGWCEKGEECGKRHVRECWRFAETGRCDKKGCREPHVLRRTHAADEEEGEEDEDEESEDDEGEMEDVAGEEAAAEGAGEKRKRRDSSDLALTAGISGAAGRRLKKLKQSARHGAGEEEDFTQQQDFVELFVPLSDEGEEDEEEGDEDEEGMSVDSEDLDSEEDEVPDGATQPAAAQQEQDPPAASTSATKPRRSRPTAAQTTDELDYGLSDDEEGEDDDDEQIAHLLRH
ncbi:hypothetical protein JCM1840_007323 [Sporobolomyces johnsonii]